MTAQAMLQRLSVRELPVCRRVNLLCERPTIARFFAVVSRLGDGVFWYSLMAILPLVHGPAAGEVVLEMALTGLISLTLYKRLKGTTLRQRPFQMDHGIRLGTAPLDAYSFPSGHTLHAVGFSCVLLSHLPVWAPLVVPFAALVAASRVVLGLHYPSDVAAGAALGGLVAATILTLGPFV